ncbi:MAG: NAD+ synthase [Methanobacteriaceae archaeon]|nr:NAD+ synthase [Methanobacteriaceae archaeon]
MIKLPEIDVDEFIERACEFIKEVVENSKTEGVVVGLSGGIDSTVIAYLAVKALGSDKVKGYILPSVTTSDEDLFDANLIKDNLDIEARLISIGNIYNEMVKSCEYESTPKKNIELATANFKPRIRMSILYYYANLYNYLVIGTGNRTELEIGYFTKYGDGGVDLLPIGDLFKEDVYAVAKALEVPDPIIRKKPTAGLWPGQTDEKELGMIYPIIDRILYLYLDEGYYEEDIADFLEIPVSEVERIIGMFNNAGHKRVMPPILSRNEYTEEEDEYNIYIEEC